MENQGMITTNSTGESENISISLLFNGIHYLLGLVYIEKKNSRFRLVVAQNGRIIYQREFKTYRGARMDFQKKYGHRNSFKKHIANWSDFFSPDPDWIKDKLGKLQPIQNPIYVEQGASLK